MSMDFSVVCDVCKESHHLGQDMAAKFCFGHSNDDTLGRYKAMMFIVTHLYCDGRETVNHGTNPDGTPRETCGAPYLRVMTSSEVPTNYKRTD